MKHCVVFCLLISLSVTLAGQINTTDSLSALHQKEISSNRIIINNIDIIGNKKTKDFIILREIVFKKGDTINAVDLNTKLEQSRQLIYNTTLFVDDSVYVLRQSENKVDVTVHVKERWYLIPLPFFVFADRNFNEWISKGASLSRVDYGVRINHYNLTGKNDKLNILLVNGYDQQISLRYQLPFMNKTLTKGFSVGYLFSRQHEMNYATSSNNEQLFLKLDNDFSRSVTRFDVTYSYRPNQKIRNYFRIAYTEERVADSVVKLNPTYYPNQLSSITYPDFTYTFQYYNSDYYAYPTKGFIGQASLYKRGFNSLTDMWQVGLRGIYAFPLKNNSYIRLEGAANIKFPYNPYFFSQALFGYGFMQLRGLEYYVVDGMAGAVGKFTFGHQFLNFVVKNKFKSTTHDKIPFRFYAKVYSDIGYGYNPYVTNNLLNNKLMRTWGFGLDIVSIYDIVFRMEYSFNQLGNKGIYLHAQ